MTESEWMKLEAWVRETVEHIGDWDGLTDAERKSAADGWMAELRQVLAPDSAPAVHPLVVDGVRHASNCRLFAYWNGRDVPEKCSCGADQPNERVEK